MAGRHPARRKHLQPAPRDLGLRHLRVSLNGLDIIGVKDLNTLKAPEVFHIEGKHMRHAMNLHRGNEAGIVACLSRHSVTADELAPFRIDRVVFGKPHCGALDARKNADRKRRRKPEAIVLHWSRADRPALDKILASNTKQITTGNNASNGISCLSMLGMSPVNSAKKNIGVG